MINLSKTPNGERPSKEYHIALLYGEKTFND
ncbi:MAG TPA: hypothetical protein ACHBX0_13105 [Arsenophonus sp.]